MESLEKLIKDTVRAGVVAGIAAATLFALRRALVRVSTKRKHATCDEEASRGSHQPDPWIVVHCASKSRRSRDREGGNRSPQGKLVCSMLEVRQEGVIGLRSVWFTFGLLKTREEDFNNYRTRGHAGRFVAGSLDRAVSLVTISAYDALQSALPDIPLHKGDLGENLLVDGPAIDAGVDLDVGVRLQIGDQVQLELTEANAPCNRLDHLHWAAEAKELVGEVQWWKSNKLPLGRHRPGGRGWLCKVLVEGIVKPGDTIHKL
mmetsp:Transcript_52591/g.96270  ORF Transcript_52591/g.96270 Transcript_52591/m.96270 type:complete len:261 (-) Transcript_52591:3-785(-)